jgi:hypothetical protein
MTGSKVRDPSPERAISRFAAHFSDEPATTEMRDEQVDCRFAIPTVAGVTVKPSDVGAGVVTTVGTTHVSLARTLPGGCASASTWRARVAPPPPVPPSDPPKESRDADTPRRGHAGGEAAEQREGAMSTATVPSW